MGDFLRHFTPMANHQLPREPRVRYQLSCSKILRMERRRFPTGMSTTFSRNFLHYAVSLYGSQQRRKLRLVSKLLKDFANFCTWREAQSSIRIQEGPPYNLKTAALSRNVGSSMVDCDPPTPGRLSWQSNPIRPLGGCSDITGLLPGRR